MGRPKTALVRAFRGRGETTLEALRAQVVKTVTRRGREFARLRAEDSDLASIPSVEELLAPWLGAPVTTEVRAERFLSILRQYQRTRHALWSDALLVAAFPMIVATRQRLKLPRALEGEGDALVLESFYEEAVRVRPSDFGALGVLGRAMARRLFVRLRRTRVKAAAETRYVQERPPLVVRPDLAAYIDLKASLAVSAEEKGLHEAMSALKDQREGRVENAQKWRRLRKRRLHARRRLRDLYDFAA